MSSILGMDILQLLSDNQAGLYGSDIVRLSKGKVSRFKVYKLLDQLVEKDWVREHEDPPRVELGGMRRTRHFITPAGYIQLAKYKKVSHGA